MKLKFKHQKFQADAAKAVVDVFAGQPYLTPSYMIDRGSEQNQIIMDADDFTGWANAKIVPELSDGQILEHIRKIQRDGQIEPSQSLEGKYNLTIEMETGVGKTYTYIKTMYELNKAYGWTKFIVVVPSIAIREGVYKSFQVTQDHFAEEYGKKIRFFIYNSSQLTEIDRFASDSSINVMIINSQAFNARGKDARRIYMKLDEFRSRRPIDIIAKTNPIVIIDEPQSVEGKQTKERLKEFHPLLTLRYSGADTGEKAMLSLLARDQDGMPLGLWRLEQPAAAQGELEVDLQTLNLPQDAELFLFCEELNEPCRSNYASPLQQITLPEEEEPTEPQEPVVTPGDEESTGTIAPVTPTSQRRTDKGRSMGTAGKIIMAVLLGLLALGLVMASVRRQSIIPLVLLILVLLLAAVVDLRAGLGFFPGL